MFGPVLVGLLHTQGQTVTARTAAGGENQFVGTQISNQDGF